MSGRFLPAFFCAPAEASHCTASPGRRRSERRPATPRAAAPKRHPATHARPCCACGDGGEGGNDEWRRAWIPPGGRRAPTAEGRRRTARRQSMELEEGGEGQDNDHSPPRTVVVGVQARRGRLNTLRARLPTSVWARSRPLLPPTPLPPPTSLPDHGRLGAQLRTPTPTELEHPGDRLAGRGHSFL